MQSTRRTTMLPLRLFDLSCRRGTPYSTPTGVITRNAKVLSTLSSTRGQEWFPQGFETSLGRRGLLYATLRCDPRLKTSRIAPVRCHGSRGEQERCGHDREHRSHTLRYRGTARPSFTAPAAPYFHLRRGLLLSCARGARLAPNRRRGEPTRPMGYCHYHLPAVVHKMDPGILAQQSDVRCKRGRLGVIMNSPAAHTSKGLAKSFVSSAGGKGPETFRGALRPLFLAYRGARLPSSGLQ